mmetsp:Transcript_2490/g.9844  ORF Transcript_2490/g.9844 Transcript_2490/m.9844 type:complete len:237 (-) Transcript_2490:724-1434(-)
MRDARTGDMQEWDAQLSELGVHRQRLGKAPDGALIEAGKPALESLQRGALCQKRCHGRRHRLLHAGNHKEIEALDGAVCPDGLDKRGQGATVAGAADHERFEAGVSRDCVSHGGAFPIAPAKATGRQRQVLERGAAADRTRERRLPIRRTAKVELQSLERPAPGDTARQSSHAGSIECWRCDAKKGQSAALGQQVAQPLRTNQPTNFKCAQRGRAVEALLEEVSAVDDCDLTTGVK